MRKIVILFLLMFCFISCKKSISYQDDNKKLFSEIINHLDHEPTHIDTLSAEMYVALNQFSDDDNAGDIVLTRVDKLLNLDTVAENQREYIEAAQVVYGVRRDEDNFWKMAIKLFNTYPTNSPQRLSSLAAYYSVIKIDPDSSSYYIDKSHKVADLMLKSYPNERLGGCVIKFSMYILQHKDNEAKSFLENFIRYEQSDENRKSAMGILINFNEVKYEILQNPAALVY